MIYQAGDMFTIDTEIIAYVATGDDFNEIGSARWHVGADVPFMLIHAPQPHPPDTKFFRFEVLYEETQLLFFLRKEQFYHLSKVA